MAEKTEIPADTAVNSSTASVNVPKSEVDQQPETAHEEEWKYPPRKVTILAIAGVYLVVFLVALDRTILGTAVPAITNEFKSFGDVAWYEAAFLLPLCVVQLTFGRIYTYYSCKWVLIAQVVVFEVGSIVCASAPNSNTLIGGRAIAGCGSAGIFSGGQILINQLLPLRIRPRVSGGIGAMFGLASILGPILGGYLTAITWRWCFWINVPIGAVSLLVLVALTPKTPPPDKAAATLFGKFMQLDPIGFILIAPSVVCLLFALQFGGTRYAWNSGTIIALLVVFGVLLVGFIISQILLGEKATLPPRILRQRSILAGAVTTIGLGSVLVIFPYYLPIWFQVIQGKSPQDSGLSLLPLLLSLVLGTISFGIVVSAVGQYAPFLIIGSSIMIVGSALITTWTVDISTGKWIGYQILTGIGIGLGLQAPQIAASAVLPQKDLTIGITIITFVSFLAGSIFVTVCQTLLQNELVTRLRAIAPDIDPSAIANAGATSLAKFVPEDKLPQALVAYNDSIRAIWYLALGLACLAFVGSWGLEWKSVKKEGEKRGEGSRERRVEEA